MFEKFSTEIKDSLNYRAPLTPPQIQAAATIYNRPIIVFNYAQKMAYFERQYLPTKHDQVLANKQVQAIDGEEPIYLFNEYKDEYHLMIHREQTLVYRMLKENKVKISHYHFEHRRFDQLRKSIYKKRGRRNKPIPLYNKDDANPDWWILDDGDLDKVNGKDGLISIVDMDDGNDSEKTQEIVMTPRRMQR